MMSTLLLLLLFLLLQLFQLSSTTDTDVDTLHFENACLGHSNTIQLRLRCSIYEHIEIIRIIYGYSKQSSHEQCQFSIYDCIQEGNSREIFDCNQKQSCSIKLSKDDIYSSTVSNPGVPKCPDLNYVQVNYGCVPDAKDICDSWKDEGPILHMSHVDSNNQEYNQCQCKVRSSLNDGQVLLHAKDISRGGFDPSSDQPMKKSTNNHDCKKTTYLEIATDRSERKCMDNLPAHGNALFGSGSQNFTLTYIRNDPLTELFFYFELKASPEKKDHHVQISCNWARRTTTTKRTTRRPMKKRKSTTLSSKLSRLDLIRHDDNDEDQSEQTWTTMINDLLFDGTSTDPSKQQEDEWSRVESFADINAFSSENRTLSQPASLLASEENLSSHRLTNKRILRIFLIAVSVGVPLFILFYLLIRKPRWIQRIKSHSQVAIFFCCEASKVLFTPSKENASASNSSNPVNENITHHRSSYPVPVIDYPSSEYYMNDTLQHCHPMGSIYDDDAGRYSFSIYDDDDDNNNFEHVISMSKYDLYRSGDSC